MRREDPLIVGAGPAGSAAAIALAQEGVRPLVCEKSAQFGDALCGGFLSWQTCRTLASLGVDPAGLGGHRVRRLRLFAGPCDATATLPEPGYGLSRRRLDAAMLARAAELGVEIVRGRRLRSVEPDGALVFAGPAKLAARTLFVAAGKDNVRGLPRRVPRAGRDPAVGLRLRLPSSPELATLLGDAIELHLFDRGYAGLVLQEDGSANLCLAVRKSLLRDADGDPGRLLERLAAAHDALAERLAGWDRSSPVEAIASVPYGWRAADTVSGRFLLGDQAVCIPSLAGEGIGIAAASGANAARFWLAGGPDAAPAFQRNLARSAAWPVFCAMALWRLTENPRSARAMIHLVRLAPALASTMARATRLRPLDLPRRDQPA